MSFLATFGAQSVLGGPDEQPRTMPGELIASYRVNTAKSITVQSITEQHSRPIDAQVELRSVNENSFGKGSRFSRTA